MFDKEIIGYDNDKFFNEILEPLFYEALSKEYDHNFYSRFDCKIPFLNGGLFEPINDYDWVNVKIPFEDKIFKDILKIFDRFNFTVKEDEPLDKEVAVDPEMLGKVFENLLDVTDRKSRGAFYTPREIVHYMCQQSLINYLETNTDVPVGDIETFIQHGELAQQITSRANVDEKYIPASIKNNRDKIDNLLKNIKIVDPAVGSGAFPMGMMNEIVKARSILSYLRKDVKSNYDLKRETIENCLYGVDIDSSAVDITKLRFWLSLVVDETDIKKIKPLPNLDHRIMCGNSLLEEFEGIKLFDERLLERIPETSDFELEQVNADVGKLYTELGEIHTGKRKDNGRKKEIETELKKLDRRKKAIVSRPKDETRQSTFDSVLENRKKESQKKLAELKRLQKDFFNEQDRKRKKELAGDIDRIEWELVVETLKEQGNEDAMQKLAQYKKNKSKPFFLWKLYFSEVFQRDNPGFDVVIANPPYVNIYKMSKDQKSSLQKTKLYKSAIKKFDLYVIFMELSLNILRNNGVSSFITSNKWLSQPYGKGIRDILLEYDILKLINFNFHVFGATVDTNITIFKKSKYTENIDILNLYSSDIGSNKDYDYIENNKKLELLFKVNNFKTLNKKIFYDIEDNNFRLNLTNEKYSLIQKIRDQSKRLDSICYIAYGLRGNAPSIKKNKSFFVKTENPNGAYKKYFEGKNISKWAFESNQFFDYQPALHYNSMFKELFESDKLVSNEIIGKSNFRIAFDSKKRYNNHTVINIVKYDLLTDTKYPPLKKQLNHEKVNITKKIDYGFLIGLLNSNLIYWYFKELLAIELHFYPNYVKQLPIKLVSHTQQYLIVNLVNQILTITKDEDYPDNPQKQTRVKTLENQIDQLVYKLYELTPEEMQIVEGFNRGK
ncbi:MAG: hypothetical protein DIAAKJNI_00393 [Candidatus Argoarchaeum ethanivorans]|uniref:site-specific DNA-methyltransferase (adenine-specific) n=1 Tax=Candidatus Argoarchaeum ethanivorans TaxID=2608793 RepID=A0A811TAI6_9EURY|nr:MAG: hypothetical protein DIAAKJNI_00393 [Candidatus Argoarchaeum ethanivorans]